MEGCGYYASPQGDLSITSRGDKITGVSFTTERGETHITPVVEQCILELDEYFFHGRKFFTVETEPEGSAFQKRVWSELINIPYGKTLSYLDLAIRLGDLNGVRAVGHASKTNPIAIIIPCHRVIGNNGDLVGYGGGLERKLWLLQHEGAFSEQLRLFLD